jgi:multiple sugar transport system substrate-binding protein
MLRCWWILVAIGAMVGVVAVAAEKPVTIELWHGTSSTYQPTLQALVDAFESEYPHITVNLIYQGSAAATQAKIDAAVASGDLPTAAIVYGNWAPQIQGLLYPIGAHMPLSEVQDVVDVLALDNTYEGVLITIPFNRSIFVLYYNADLVRTPPATWAEYSALAASLTADSNGDGAFERYGTAFRPEARPEYFLVFLNQAGGSVLNDDWTEVTVNDAAGVAAIEFLESLIPYSFITTDYLNNHMGQIAMFLDSSASYDYIAAGARDAGYTLGVATLPAGRGSPNTIMEGTNFAVFDVPNQAQGQKDAAVLLARFLLRPENTVSWAIGSGSQPVTKSAYELQAWRDYVATHPYRQVMSAQTLLGFSVPLHPEYLEMRSIMAVRFGEVMRGTTGAVDGLNLMAEEIRNLLGL